MFRRAILISCISAAVLCIPACSGRQPKQETPQPVDYIKAIPEPSDPVPVATAKKGEVLVGYSDCYTCHKEDQRSVGPAFKAIAKRYPVNPAYVDYLAEKVIQGGSGSWGNAVMTPHSQLSPDNVKIMVRYILSLRSND